ncbi:TPR domain protein [Parvularcula bermudensis HTCC2503]|uniref:TPR domain protein n=1 Tax=Parvularcula bermudensis (strain ATCC BAA-594 / HTCC2503 / KCTC 12087) TaxID=314260 RepID=E0TGM0_PARBH|nr:tetratricopeptide repeat protein [Parvularcula bermudensis]ADM10152.1 TPR domain protein [Parvularcula bermudensis HTCC2503]
MRFLWIFLVVGLSAPTPSLADISAPQTRPAVETPRETMLRWELTVRAEPDNTDARIELARAHLALGDADRAEKMAAAVLLREDRPAARLILAEAQFRQGRSEEALTTLDGGQRLSGGSADLAQPSLRTVIEAEKAVTDGKPQLALEKLEALPQKGAYASMGKMIAARAHYALGDLLAARSAIDTIIGGDGESMTALLFKAQIALRSGDYGAALRLARGIDAIDPGNVTAGVIAVEALLRIGDEATAQTTITDLAAANPDDPRPTYLKALLLAEQGQMKQAADTVSSIEPWLERREGGAVFLARLKLAEQRPAQAEQLLRARLREQATDIAARQLLVSILDERGEEAEAARVLERGLAFAPRHPVLLRLKADRLIDAGEIDAAAAVLAPLGGAANQWLALLDRDGDPDLFTQVLTAIRAGEDEEVLRLAAENTAQIPTDPVTGNLLAGALAQTGEVEAARQLLDRIIAAHPDELVLIANRAQLDPDADALVTALERAVEAGARDPDIYEALGRERYVLGEIDQALEAAQRAAEAKEARLAQRTLPGRLLLAAGRADAAQKALRAVDLRETDSAAERASLAKLLLADAPDSAAIAAADLDGPGAVILRAQIEKARGRSDSARTLLVQGMATYPLDAPLAEAALIDLATTDLSAAMTALEETRAIPTSLKESLALKLFWEAKDRVAFAEALASATPSLPLFTVRARLAEANDRLSLLGDLEAYVLATPNDRGARLLLGALALEMDRDGLAEKALTTALADTPGDPLLLNNLALARADRAPQDALRLAKEAYMAAPTSADIASTYAQMLTATGDAARAGRVARRALILHPERRDLDAYAARIGAPGSEAIGAEEGDQP